MTVQLQFDDADIRRLITCEVKRMGYKLDGEIIISHADMRREGLTVSTYSAFCSGRLLLNAERPVA